MNMIGVKKNITLYLPFFLGLFCVACNNSNVNDAAPPVMAEKQKEKAANKNDAAAINDAYTEGLLAMRIADTIKQYGTSDKIKELALASSDLHSDINAQIAGMALDKDIELPKDITAEQLEELNSIGKATNNIVDKAYLDIIIARYAAMIEHYEAYAKEAKDDAIQRWFNKALPLLRGQMENMKAVRREL